MKNVTPRGVVIFSGPSEIDSQPIVAIATLQTANRKTGNMIQIWILPLEMDPISSLRAGKNASICGNCPLQGTFDFKNQKMENRVCYVNLGHAPLQVWKSNLAGRYPKLDKRLHTPLFENRSIRLGAYGDPAALPDSLLEWLTSVSGKWTGYTHQIFNVSKSRARFLASILMVSCHNVAQHLACERNGWRSFTVVPESIERKPDLMAKINAIECPADSRGISCEKCLLCMGKSKPAKSIYILSHGPGSKSIERMPQTVK